MPGKQEIDKEAMFRKIMPSAAFPPAASDVEPPAEAAASASPIAPPPADTPAEAPAAPDIAAIADVDAAPEVDDAPQPDDIPRHQVMTGEMPPHPPAAPEPPPEAYAVEPEQPPRPRRPVDPDKVPEWTGEKHLQPEAAPPAPAMAAAAQAAAAQFGDVPAAEIQPVAQAPAPGPVGRAGSPANSPRPVNLAEILMEDLYPRYRAKLNGCPCARCQDDACGIALNKVTPHYMASDRLDTSRLRDRALVTETVTALMRALFIVKRRPRHTAQDLQGLQNLPATAAQAP